MVQSKFSPLEHGFQFVNRFDLRLPVHFRLPFAGSVNLNEIVFGLCGGMCFSALDYFYSGKSRPSEADVDAIDQNLYAYLCERQLESLSIPVLLKVIEWMLLDDQQITTRMHRAEIPRLRRSLDKGDPQVLALIRVTGNSSPTQNHQVIATGYSLDPETGLLEIALYDPNHPRLEPYLQVKSGAGGLELFQSTGEPLRGFFIIPYKTRRTLPRPPIARPGFRPAAPLPLQLHWPVDSRRVNQYFGENPETYRPFGLPGHEGLDLYALTGANVYAAADGEVYEVGKPKDHPYGLQVRLLHKAGNLVFRTIYAHLSQTFVKAGQKVEAGALLGLADNTGNSFGSHLHFTLKVEGERTPGYPAGIVDPWPYFQEVVVPPDEPLPSPSGINVVTLGQANLRFAPGLDTKVLAMLPAGETLAVLGEAALAELKIGQPGEWLQVQTAAGQAGWVAAWLVQDPRKVIPPTNLVVYPYEAVNLRAGPGQGFDLLGALTYADPLTILGSEETARKKIGKQNEWLQVQTETGQRGFVAAWLVHLTGQMPPQSGLQVFPQEIINVRARPALDAHILTTALPGDALEVLGDKVPAMASIGQAGRWLNVRTPAKYNGYIAAWLVQLAGGATPPNPPGAGGLVVFPTAEINLRAQPSLNSPRVDGAHTGEGLQVIEADLAAARQKVGQPDQWLSVQKGTGERGWVAAWFVKI